MYPRVLVTLVVAVVLASLATGCGGDEQGDNSSRREAKKEQTTQSQGQKGQGEQTQGDERMNKQQDRKTITGLVAKVDTEKNLLWVKPKNQEIMRFVFRPETLKVTRDGEEAGQEDIKKGEQATVTFVVVEAVKKDVTRNIARAVKIEPAGEKESTTETTG